MYIPAVQVFLHGTTRLVNPNGIQMSAKAKLDANGYKRVTCKPSHATWKMAEKEVRSTKPANTASLEAMRKINQAILDGEVGKLSSKKNRGKKYDMRTAAGRRAASKHACKGQAPINLGTTIEA